jgi:sugar phosphate permease
MLSILRWLIHYAVLISHYNFHMTKSDIPDLTEPTTLEKIRGLPWVLAMSASLAIHARFLFFGSSFVLFLNQIGFNKTQIGGLLSLLPFLGLTALFAAPWVAQRGVKRVYLTFFGARNIFVFLLLFTPAVYLRWGTTWTFVYIAGLMVFYSLFRAIGETGHYPWQQEYIPDAIRGKFTATSNIIANIARLIAVSFAAYVVGSSEDLGRFMLLFGLGGVFGLGAVWAASHIPGGEANPEVESKRPDFKGMAQTLRDRSFLAFLLGVGMLTLINLPIFSFVPLFMREKVSLSDGNVVWLQTGVLLASMGTGYLWGWAADRYGSKPVMLSGVIAKAILPIFWLVMPRATSASFLIALGISFWQGFAAQGWWIGHTRLLFVRIVPARKKTAYMAVYYAWIGLVGGASRLISGVLLDQFADLSRQVGFIQIDAYTILFVAGIVVPLLSLLVFRFVRADSPVSLSEFAGKFIHGNVFMAVESIIRYQLARDEETTVAATERLGLAHSPLAVDELLATLDDPRFNVRFEAIISMARHGPDARLIEALAKVLRGSEPALGVVAAWALGRMGDPQALPALREGLDSPYRSIRAHSARALGTLGDETVIPRLLENLEKEPDFSLRLAYGSALGKMRVQAAVPGLLTLLANCPDLENQQTTALAIGRVIGDEHDFIRLLGQTGSSDPGTAIAQALVDLKKGLADLDSGEYDLPGMLDDASESFARSELAEGVTKLQAILRALPETYFGQLCSEILEACQSQMARYGAQRLDYVVLALHTVAMGRCA